MTNCVQITHKSEKQNMERVMVKGDVPPPSKQIYYVSTLDKRRVYNK